ncbi:hypothetical protein COT07_02330 [Candidatus Woesearchaeota archaeon CG07_land_8_20_14_0_80_44_23]|nr:MAG: hypothetical protein COT07_02330 [Candidatus Woesearchaeota archaeon CG07_land_8_20_14_0_80_44_23]
MKQKSYEMEIVNFLLKERGHVRAIAKQIGTNPMTVQRKLKILIDENAVDYKIEGRNKVYFLKRSEEARIFGFLGETYKLLECLDKYPRIRAAVKAIRSDRRIKLALLFGSYAKGLASDKSDIDIYIEGKDQKIKDELIALDSKLSIKTGKYDRKSPLIREIERNHVIIKGVEEYYERSGFFEEGV